MDRAWRKTLRKSTLLRHTLSSHKEEGGLLEAAEKFMVMVSRMDRYLQTHQDVYIKHAQLSCLSTIYLN